MDIASSASIVRTGCAWDACERLVRIQSYHTQVFATFVRKLAELPDGDGSMLDRSLILYGSNMSNSNAHDHFPLPLAAGAASCAGASTCAIPTARRYRTCYSRCSIAPVCRSSRSATARASAPIFDHPFGLWGTAARLSDSRCDASGSANEKQSEQIAREIEPACVRGGDTSI
jgi:hypothetical protein